MGGTDDFVTVAEAARLRGVSKARIRQWIKEGRLGRIEKYGRVLVKRREVETLKALAVGRPPKN